jgi:hypothetical protein
MAQAYTPGLKVTARTRHRARRVLPIPGDVLVTVGQTVGPRDIVAQTFMPGDVTPLNMANLLSIAPEEVPECMLKHGGERVTVGEDMARSKGIFGMFKSTYKSKTAGTIETISGVTGQVIVRGEPIPVQVESYLAGTVVEVIPREGCVIEADVSFIQGIFGIGGEAHGPIKLACQSHEEELHEDLITPEMKGCVVVGGARVTNEAIRRAVHVGASAIVTGGIDDHDLKDVLGYDLGVAITGSERIGLTIVITEGFGEIAMAQRTYKLLASREGAAAAVNGATQIRAGVMRPEVLISLSAVGSRLSATSDTNTESRQPTADSAPPGQLEIGRAVRIIRDPYFGLIGAVCGLPHEPQVLGSGSKARVLEVKFESGKRVVIPRANVELIEG